MESRTNDLEYWATGRWFVNQIAESMRPKNEEDPVKILNFAAEKKATLLKGHASGPGPLDADRSTGIVAEHSSRPTCD